MANSSRTLSRWLLAGAVCSTFMTGFVSAQENDNEMIEMSLEDLLATPVSVWSATKTEETVDTAPSIVEVITAADIERWGYLSVAEVLQHMLGFYIVDDQIIPNVAVRGVSGGLGSESGIIKVMINGRSVAFRASAGNWLGMELIPITTISRIEVIRGPASALYGADAFMATVNVVLKRPEEMNGATFRGNLNAQTDAFGDADSFSAMNNSYDAVGGAEIKDFGFLLSVGGEHSVRRSLNLPDSSPAPRIPAYNEGKTSIASQVHDSNVFYGELSYDRPKGSIRFSGYTSAIDRGGELSRWTHLSKGIDHLGRANETRIHLNNTILGLDGVIRPSDKVTVNLNLSYFTGSPLSDDRIEVGSDLYYIRRDFSYHSVNPVAEVQWKLIKPLMLVIGTELIYDKQNLPDNQRIDKVTGEKIDTLDNGELPDSQEFVNPAVYLQANLDAVPERLKLTGGVRYDYHNIYGSKVTGRAGIVLMWTKRFTSKLLYGNAFKAPSPQMLYATPLLPGDIIGNPDLRPQFIHTVEFAQSLRPAKYMTLHSTLAYNHIIDKTEFMPQGINIVAMNVSTVQGLSLETGVTTAYRDILTGNVSMEFQWVMRDQGDQGYRSDVVGTENIIAPPWVFRAGFSSMLPFLDPVPVRIGSELMIVGARRASSENIVENGGSYFLPEYAMLDALIALPDLKLLPNGKTTFTLKFSNLLNETGPDPGFSGIDYPLMSRQIMLDLRQTF